MIDILESSQFALIYQKGGWKFFNLFYGNIVSFNIFEELKQEKSLHFFSEKMLIGIYELSHVAAEQKEAFIKL